MDEFDRKISREMKQRVQGISLTDQGKEQVQREIRRPSDKTRKRSYFTWTVAVAAAALFLFLAIPLLQQSISEQDSGSPLPDDFYDGMEKLELNVLEEKKLDDGTTEYMIEVNNGTKRNIRQAVVSISFDIKLENGIAGNPFKQSWGIPQDIEAGQKITIPMITDAGIFKEVHVNTNSATLDLVGYLDELKPENIFSAHQSNSSIDGEGNVE